MTTPDSKLAGLVRKASVVALVVVPVAAVAVIGAGLVGGSAGIAAPSGLLLNETRAYNNQGATITGQTAPAAATPEQFNATWQNTVRTPPSPRV